MREFRTLSLLVCLAYGSHANAWSLAEMLGLDKVARDAARETAAAMIIASRNIAIMTNQFGVLISDYHGTDPKKREEAKSIIEGVFGVKLSETEKFSVEVRVTALGLKDGEVLRGDLLFLDAPDIESVKTELKSGLYFKPETINGPQEIPSSNHDVETEMSKFLKDYTARDTVKKKCLEGGCQGFSCTFSIDTECASQVEQELLKNAVMAVRNTRQQLPINSSFSRSYPGGRYAAVLIHAEDWKTIQDHTEIRLIVHKGGDPRTLYGHSQDSPFIVSAQQLRTNIASTDEEEWSEIRFAIVDLRLNGVLVDKILAQRSVLQ